MKASDVTVPVKYKLEHEERSLLEEVDNVSSGACLEQEIRESNGHNLVPRNVDSSLPLFSNEVHEKRDSEVSPLLHGVSSSSCHQNKALGRDSESDSSVSGRICRFCLDNESEVRGDELIAPCLCIGSVKYVHRSCLSKWRQSSPSQAKKCGSCKTEFKMILMDKPWKKLLRHRILLPVALVLLWIAIAPLLGLLPVAHENENIGWYYLNGEIVLGAVGLGMAGIELLSWRSAARSVMGVRGRFWQAGRIAVWYIWRLYVLLCGGLILFLAAYPWFFKMFVALFGIIWMEIRLTMLCSQWGQPHSDVQALHDVEREQLMQERREQEEREREERALAEEVQEEQRHVQGEDNALVEEQGQPSPNEQSQQQVELVMVTASALIRDEGASEGDVQTSHTAFQGLMPAAIEASSNDSVRMEVLPEHSQPVSPPCETMQTMEAVLSVERQTYVDVEQGGGIFQVAVGGDVSSAPQR